MPYRTARKGLVTEGPRYGLGRVEPAQKRLIYVIAVISEYSQFKEGFVL